MKNCTIYYHTLTDEMRKEEKWEWFSENKIQNIPFQHIIPDKNNNWLNQTDNDWEDLIPLANKETKLAKSKNEEKAVFKLFSLGVVTARDEWVYDYNKENLEKKVEYLIQIYNNDVDRLKNVEKSDIKDNVDYQIKWTRAVKNDLYKGKKYGYKTNLKLKSIYRPYINEYLYFAKELNEMQYQLNNIFPDVETPINFVIAVNIGNKPFNVLLTNILPDYHLNGDSQCLPLYRYESNGNRIENITDWGLEQFHKHYEDDSITKENIFHYVYGVLHNPAYRKKYELNLKRDFPRIPFYDDFWKWADWGKKLMDLHINFETVEPYPLQINEYELGKKVNKPKLKANKDLGEIVLDEIATLSGIPKEVWDYKLGNRSALEWILDQYKEKKPKDPTIAEKFNTYRFADYKEKVIDLLKRVTTVSVETVKIVREMKTT